MERGLNNGAVSYCYTFSRDSSTNLFFGQRRKEKGAIKIIWWLCSIPVIVFCIIGIVSYQSGRELKEEIKKGFN